MAVFILYPSKGFSKERPPRKDFRTPPVPVFKNHFFAAMGATAKKALPPPGLKSWDGAFNANLP